MTKNKIYQFLLRNCVLLFLATNLYASAQGLADDVFIRKCSRDDGETGKTRVDTIGNNKILVSYLCENKNLDLKSVIIRKENGVNDGPLSKPKFYTEPLENEMLYVISFDLPFDSNNYNTINIKLKDRISNEESVVTAYFPEFNVKIVPCTENKDDSSGSLFYSDVSEQCLELTNSSPNAIELIKVCSTLDNDTDILLQVTSTITVEKGEKYPIKLSRLLVDSNLPKINMQYKVAGSDENIDATIHLSKKPREVIKQSWLSAIKYTAIGAVGAVMVAKVRDYFAKPKENYVVRADPSEGDDRKEFGDKPPVSGPSGGTFFLSQSYDTLAVVRTEIEERQIVQEEARVRDDILLSESRNREAAARAAVTAELREQVKRQIREYAERQAQEADNRRGIVEEEAASRHEILLSASRSREAVRQVEAANQAREDAARQAQAAIETTHRTQRQALAYAENAVAEGIQADNTTVNLGGGVTPRTPRRGVSFFVGEATLVSPPSGAESIPSQSEGRRPKPNEEREEKEDQIDLKYKRLKIDEMEKLSDKTLINKREEYKKNLSNGMYSIEQEKVKAKWLLNLYKNELNKRKRK